MFASTKENGKDTLVYSAKLIDSNTRAVVDNSPFLLPSRLIASKKADQRTTLWSPASISLDDKQVALILNNGYSDRPLYIVDISGASPQEPELLTLPGATEKLGDDFSSVVAYDTRARTVTHITTPEPGLRALRPIPWETGGLLVTPAALFFRANVEGWQTMYAVPFSGAHANVVLEVRCARGWEGSPVGYAANVRNARPSELVVHFNSFRMNGFLASLDFSSVVAYDTRARTVTHITTPEPGLRAPPRGHIARPRRARRNSRRTRRNCSSLRASTGWRCPACTTTPMTGKRPCPSSSISTEARRVRAPPARGCPCRPSIHRTSTDSLLTPTC